MAHAIRPHARILPTLAACLFALYALVPIAYLLFSTTKTNGELFATFALWFGSHLNLSENLHELLTARDGVFLVWMRNSFTYAIVASLGAAFFSALAAYAFSKYRFPGSRILYAVTLGAVMVPPTAIVLPTFLLLSSWGMVGTAASVILPQIPFPLGVYLLKAFIDDAVPDELIEAARMDGAGEITIFTTIALRLVAPALITVFLLGFVSSWNNFFLPLVMINSPEAMPLTVGLAGWFQQANMGSVSEVRMPVVFAAALVGTLPVLIVFLLLQRFWQGGLASGAVKG